jgi:MFS family permease
LHQLTHTQLTCIVAFQGFILLVNFPEDAHKSWRFLTERESKWVVQQINADRSDALPEKFHFGAYCRTALDFKLWVFGLLFFAVLTTPYAIGFFLPAILGSMGFSSAESQYLTAPPYFFAGIIMVLFGWVGDKYKMRGPLIIAGTFLTIIGLCMTGFLKSNPARYAGVFLTLAGANSVIPALMAYQANNIVGSTKRAMSSALFVGLGGVGGIAGSLVFRQQDAPTYVPGMIACLVLSGFIILTVCVMSVYFRFMNAKADRGEIILENTPGFRYTI